MILMIIVLVVVAAVVAVATARQRPRPRLIQTVRDRRADHSFCQRMIAQSGDPSLVREIYDNNDIRRFLARHFSSDVQKAFSRINPAYGACVSDFARYCLVYIRGGAYLDIKSRVNRPLQPLFDRFFGGGGGGGGDALVVTHWPGGYRPHADTLAMERGEICNWVFLCTARHPVLKLVIDAAVDNILSGRYRGARGKEAVLAMTGPILFSRIIRRAMFEEQYKGSIVITDELHSYFTYNTTDCSGNCRSAYYGSTPSYDIISNRDIVYVEKSIR